MCVCVCVCARACVCVCVCFSPSRYDNLSMTQLQRALGILDALIIQFCSCQVGDYSLFSQILILFQGHSVLVVERRLVVISLFREHFQSLVLLCTNTLHVVSQDFISAKIVHAEIPCPLKIKFKFKPGGNAVRHTRVRRFPDIH